VSQVKRVQMKLNGYLILTVCAFAAIGESRSQSPRGTRAARTIIVYTTTPDLHD